MKVLYRRIVAIGMISFSAVLGWIYCILEYRDKPIYIAVISLVLVASVYCLLNSYIGLTLEREAKRQRCMAETITEAISKLESDGSSEEALRLDKAAYVQLRKTNTILARLAEEIGKNEQQRSENGLLSNDSAAHLITETINKSTKIIVKYNQSNNTEMSATIRELSSNLDRIGRELERVSEELTNRVLSAPQTNEQPSADVIMFPVPEETPKSFETETAPEDYTSIETVSTDTVSTDMVSTDAVSTDDANRQLSADEIAALFASVSVDSNPDAAEEETAEELEHEETTENAEATENVETTDDAEVTDEDAAPPLDDNPNRQMSQDEIAALLASMQG